MVRTAPSGRSRSRSRRIKDDEQDVASDGSSPSPDESRRQQFAGKAGSGVRGGSFEYFQQMQAAGIPEGYKSITELAEWPREKLIAIFGAGSPSGASQRRRRFESVLQYGMMMHTDFTGKGSVEQAMRMLGVTMEEPTRNIFQGVARVM
jgi:hypothetical protein